MKLYKSYNSNKVRTFSLLMCFILAGFLSVSCRYNDDEGKDNVVKITMSEYEMEVLGADDVKPGVTVFEVTNNGEREHSFVIEGIDTMQEIDGKLKPGETRSMSLELKPSRYNIYCPIDNHKNKGMASVIKVQEPEDTEPAPDPAE